MKNDTIYSNRLIGILQKKVAYAIMPLGKKAKKNYKVQKSHLPSVTRFGHGNQISIYQNFLDVKFFTSFFVLIFTSQNIFNDFSQNKRRKDK